MIISIIEIITAVFIKANINGMCTIILPTVVWPEMHSSALHLSRVQHPTVSLECSVALASDEQAHSAASWRTSLAASSVASPARNVTRLDATKTCHLRSVKHWSVMSAVTLTEPFVTALTGANVTTDSMAHTASLTLGKSVLNAHAATASAKTKSLL